MEMMMKSQEEIAAAYDEAFIKCRQRLDALERELETPSPKGHQMIVDDLRRMIIHLEAQMAAFRWVLSDER